MHLTMGMKTGAAHIMQCQIFRLTFSRPSFWIAVGMLLCVSMPASAVDYFDDFARPDGPELGSNWIEKNPAAFGIAGGLAAKGAVSTGYRDNIAYRPSVEDLLDAEASVEMRVLNTAVGYPQVFVRVQGNTAATSNSLDAYILYVNNSTTSAVLGRQRGSAFVTTLADIFLSTPLNTTDRYRLRLRATGTNPVNLSAWIERDNAGDWQVIGEASVADAAATRISTPGAVGFGGYVESSYTFDNFNRLDLQGGGQNNPAPGTTGLVPNSIDEGSSSFSLIVDGSDFVPGATVRWNGADRATTFVSETQLQANITAADVGSPGTASVTVFNPAPGGGLSNAQSFTVTAIPGNPVPTTSDVSPNTAEAGGSGFSLTVNGSGFVPGSTVRWGGMDRQTAYISATQLQAVIDSADIATAGTTAVRVFSPGPGGGLSNAQNFTITNPANNPQPILTLLTPSSATEGSSGFTLAVDGQDFIPESRVFWNGSERTTSFVTSNRLNATISSSDIASAGFANVTVVSPAPGGGTSNTLQFEILSGGGTGGNAQNLTNISPVSVAAGANGVQLTLNGAGFTQNSVVQVGGVAVNTVYVSDQQLLADVSAGLLATEQRSAVTVRTPSANNVVTNPQTLFVLDTGETVYFDNFNRPDSPDIGNNWTEKVPSVFSLANGEVSGVATPSQGFNHLITYRPPAEDAQNVEVGMEFTRTPGVDSWYPQVHARVQRDTVQYSSSLSSYTLFYDSFFNPGQIHVTPIDDYYECYLASWDVTEAFIEGDRYRLRFQVTGTNPVRLTGYMEHLTADNWEVIASGTVLHDQNSQAVPGGFCNTPQMIAPITGTGATGFAKWRDASDRYDNFYTIRLGEGSNPAPVTSGLTPSSAQQGSSPFTLTVAGSNFGPGSVVRWGGSDRPTTFVSPGELQASISAADLASQGAVTVTVRNPAPGGGISNAQNFTVTVPAGNPIPGLTSVMPDLVVVDSAGFTLTAQGVNFVPGSIVRWNGQDRATAYSSATQLQASINASDIETAGTALITVYNPGPGGGESASIALTILDPGTDYFDDFSRPDAATLGAGWIEKQPGAFSLGGSSAVKNAVSTGYRDNLVYRPAEEDLLDVEASVELNFTSPSVGYPQLWVRVRSDTAAIGNMADGYMLYMNNSSTQAVLGRQRGNVFVQSLATFNLTTPLNTTDQFRLRLRAIGTNPVLLDANIERLGPSGWEIIGQASASDSSANRLDTPGSVGFGGYVESSYLFDNFTRLYQGP